MVSLYNSFRTQIIWVQTVDSKISKIKGYLDHLTRWSWMVIENCLCLKLIKIPSSIKYPNRLPFIKTRHWLVYLSIGAERHCIKLASQYINGCQKDKITFGSFGLHLNQFWTEQVSNYWVFITLLMQVKWAELSQNWYLKVIFVEFKDFYKTHSRDLLERTWLDNLCII